MKYKFSFNKIHNWEFILVSLRCCPYTVKDEYSVLLARLWEASNALYQAWMISAVHIPTFKMAKVR